MLQIKSQVNISTSKVCRVRANLEYFPTFDTRQKPLHFLKSKRIAKNL